MQANGLKSPLNSRVTSLSLKFLITNSWIILFFNDSVLNISCFQLFDPVKSFLNFLAEEVELNAFDNTLSLLFLVHPLIVTGQLCFHCIRATIVCSGDHSRVAELYFSLNDCGFFDSLSCASTLLLLRSEFRPHRKLTSEFKILIPYPGTSSIWISFSISIRQGVLWIDTSDIFIKYP